MDSPPFTPYVVCSEPKMQIKSTDRKGASEMLMKLTPGAS